MGNSISMFHQKIDTSLSKILHSTENEAQPSEKKLSCTSENDSSVPNIDDIHVESPRGREDL